MIIDILMLWVIILFWLLERIIIIDIILSWFIVFWLNYRPLFVAQIIDPVYIFIKKYIPTSIWPFDFTPIIIIFIMEIIKNILISFNPNILNILNLMKNNV
jgi:uncharacterized protein YggT (Ycf19 family)